MVRLSSYYDDLKKKECPDIERRCGRFSIPEDYLYDHPDEALKVFGHFIILRAESMLRTRTVEYDALSMLFDVLPDGNRFPWYIIEAATRTDGTLIIKANREGSEHNQVRSIRFKRRSA